MSGRIGICKRLKIFRPIGIEGSTPFSCTSRGLLYLSIDVSAYIPEMKATSHMIMYIVSFQIWFIRWYIVHKVFLTWSRKWVSFMCHCQMIRIWMLFVIKDNPHMELTFHKPRNLAAPSLYGMTESGRSGESGSTCTRVINGVNHTHQYDTRHLENSLNACRWIPYKPDAVLWATKLTVRLDAS